MNSNMNGIFNRVSDWIGKAGDLSNNISGWLGKSSKDNTFSTPSFNNTQRTDSLFRRLAMNYAPTQATQQTGSIRDKVIETKLNDDKSFTAAISREELGIKGKWRAFDPRKASEIAYKKAVLKLGITTDEKQAELIAQKASPGGITLQYGKVTRPVKDLDFANPGYMDHVIDKQSNFILTIPKAQVEAIYTAAESVVGKKEVDYARLKNDFPVFSQKTEAGVGMTAAGGAVLRLPPPVIAVGVMAGVGAYTLGRWGDVMRDNDLTAARTNSLPIPIPTFNMEDAGDAPPARPTDTADRPAQPKVGPIAGPDTQPGQELEVRPNAPPATAKPEAKAKPDVDINKLPQPYKIPRNEQPPQNEPPRLPKIPKGVPEIITGATTAITGKVAVDAINGTNAATPPEFTTAADPAFDVSHLDLQQVAPGSTDLSRAVIDYRIQNKVSIYKNVAAFEYKDLKGNPQLKIFESSEGGQHSERRIAEWMRENNIKPEQVTRVYTELEPCSTRNSFCKQYLAKNTPQAKVSYSFEYGDNKPSKQRGVKELKRYAQDLMKGTK